MSEQIQYIISILIILISNHYYFNRQQKILKLYKYRVEHLEELHNIYKIFSIEVARSYYESTEQYESAKKCNDILIDLNNKIDKEFEKK